MRRIVVAALILTILLVPVLALAQTTIGVDPATNVALINEGQPPSAMPATVNGQAITVYTLTGPQLNAMRALDPNNNGIRFNGTTFSIIAPVQPPVPQDADGFVLDCKAAVGGPANIPAARIPQALLLWDAIRSRNWADAQVMIIAAQSGGIISGPQYAAIKAAAVVRNIPVTLP